MGFAFDGDADRMLAVDAQGRVVDGDHVLYLWGTVLQEQKALPGERLVATVMSNLGFERPGSGAVVCSNARPSATSTSMPRWWPVEPLLGVSSRATSLRHPMGSAVMGC